MTRSGVTSVIALAKRIDPVAELAKVHVPVLIVQGTTDLQVTVDDAYRLAAARPGSAPVLVKGMNHVLKQAPLERASNLAADVNPSLPLAPRLLSAIAAFLKQELTSASPNLR